MNKSLKIILISSITLIILFHLFLSIKVNIDYYDCFDYLRNARSIIEKNNNTYAYISIRPILIPLLEIPFLKIFNSPNTIIKSIHLFFSVVSFFSIITIYKLSTTLTSKNKTHLIASLFAPLGLLSNKLFTHYFFFGMPDIFTSLLIILLLNFTVKLNKKNNTKKNNIIFLILLLLSLTKFYFIIFSLFYVIFLNYFLKIKTKKLLISFTTIFTTFIILHITPLIYIGCKHPIQRFTNTIYKLLLYKLNNKYEFPQEYLFALLNSTALIYVIIFIIGLITILKNKEKNYTPIFFTFFSILILISIYPHKESRYLIPILPSFYLVCTYGLIQLNQLIKNKTIYNLFLIILTVSSIYNWFNEIYKFKNRIYYSNYHIKLTKSIIKLNTKAKITWFGNFITLSPKNINKILIQKNDDFMYKFHISTNCLYALRGIPCIFAYTNVEKDFLFPPEHINLEKISYSIFADTATNEKLPLIGIYKTYKTTFKQLINKNLITIKKSKDKILISIKKFYSAKITTIGEEKTIKIRLKNKTQTSIPKNIYNKILNKKIKFQTLNLINY